MTQLKMAVAGVAGRMGRQLAAMAIDRGHALTGGSEVAAAGVFTASGPTLR